MFGQPATEVKNRHRELRCRMAAGIAFAGYYIAR
jgi:hypothetical protein